MPIYALRTTIGQEQSLSRYLTKRAESRDHLNIYSILVPGAIKGYIFVEANSIDDVEVLVEGVRHVRKRPRASRDTEVPIDELEHFWTVRSISERVSVHDIVEIIDGPFKGSKARVMDISKKEEVTVELLSTDLQIPITIAGSSVRVIEKAEPEEEEEGEYLL